MNHLIYQGKYILVSGASSRTGKSIARYLLNSGAHVFLNYRHNVKGVEQLRREFNDNQCWAVQGNVCEEEEVIKLVNQVRKVTASLHGLINVVGEYLEAPFKQTSFSSWKKIQVSNLDSVFLMCQQFYPLLKKSSHGRVINFAYSNADRVMASKTLPYHIAKMGVISLTKTLAREWGNDGISVNVISPGVLFNSITKPSNDPKDFIPQQRFGKYDDIRPVLDLIFREDSTYLTGNNFVLSGGYNL